HYAHWLREVLMPLLPYEGLLWILRVVLLACLVLHVGCAVLLIVRARRARGPHRRRGLSGVDSRFARSMPVTGVIILPTTRAARPGSSCSSPQRRRCCGRHVIEERYGNLFEMYTDATEEDP